MPLPKNHYCKYTHLLCLYYKQCSAQRCHLCVHALLEVEILLWQVQLWPRVEQQNQCFFFQEERRELIWG